MASPFNLWSIRPAQNNFMMNPACMYQMPPNLRNNWWFGLLNAVPMDQFQRIYQWFMSVDTDRSGSLEINELMSGQFPGGIRMSPQTALRMMRIFDTDFNGNISFYEFIALYKFLEVVYNLFYANDKDRSGTMEPHEINPALQQLGFHVTPRTAVTLHKVFAHGSVMCDMNCFVSLCAFTAQSRTAYEMLLNNPFYGPRKPFNPAEFGKFLDVVTSLLE
ncbi:Sorcin [Entamoeba marina]